MFQARIRFCGLFFVSLLVQMVIYADICLSVVSIAGGGDFCLALRSNGTVWAWGQNSSGQLGNPGYPLGSQTPVPVLNASGTGPLMNIIGIAAGEINAIALTSSGNVYTWGNAGPVASVLPVLTPDSGGVTPMAGILQVAAAASGGGYYALTQSGSVYAWGGTNSNGELGNGVVGGAVFPPQLVRNLTNTAPLTGVQSIAASRGTGLALLVNGTLAVWGDGQQGEIGQGNFSSALVPKIVKGPTGGATVLDNLTAIAGGSFSIYALSNDSTLWSWAFNTTGQLGNGQIGGLPASACCTNLPGRVFSPSGGPDLFENAIAVAGGQDHALFLKSDSTVWAVGANNFGQLGNGTNVLSTLPVQVKDGNGTAPLKNIVAISSGFDSLSLALTNLGTIWSWGYGGNGGLGNGSTANASLPVLVTFPDSAEPPTGFFGSISRKCTFLNRKLWKGFLEWEPSPSPNVVLYRIYLYDALVDTVSASSPRELEVCLKKRTDIAHFFISAVDAGGHESCRIQVQVIL